MLLEATPTFRQQPLAYTELMKRASRSRKTALAPSQQDSEGPMSQLSQYMYS